MSRPEAVVIAGPTASGKSALALDLARRTGGTVVNADSMQVYTDLRILTARPTSKDEHDAPHALYGHVDGATNYSVGRYLREATDLLRSLEADGSLPIVVGGTGLYLRALLTGLSNLPPVPDEIRARVRAEAVARPTSDLHAELAGRDPASAARLRASDRLRVLRALEFHAATGRSLAGFDGGATPGPLSGKRIANVFLSPDRAQLRARIDARFAAMIDAGSLDEAGALAARHLDPALPIMRAHGVPGLLAHLRGDITLDEAINRGQADTRRYVKRQWTWARHQMPDVPQLPPEEARAHLCAALGLD